MGILFSVVRRRNTALKLERKVAVVTGSTKGIGRAIAEAFAREGAIVVINSRDQETTEIVAAEVSSQAIGVGADLATNDGVNSLFAAVEKRFGGVDVLVNNAAIPMIRDSIDITLEDWQRTLDMNLTSPLLCSQRAARSMLRRAGGSIVNIASIASFAAFPKRVAYATSKAGLVMMTRVLAIEWAPKIRVNAVAPGHVRTKTVQTFIDDGTVDVDAVIRRTPQRRLGTPEEIAEVCAFLASDDASFITGETLVADGGWLAYGFL